MPYSYNRITGNGATTLWGFNFSGGYISRQHVRAVTIDPDTFERTPVEFTFVGPNTISVVPALPVGTVLEIYRDTPLDRPLVDFQDGAILNEANLDTTTEQAIFVSQELYDRTLRDEQVGGLTLQGPLDMAGNDILNVRHLYADDAIIDGYSVLDRIDAARATPADPLQVELRRQPPFSPTTDVESGVPLLYPYDGPLEGLLVYRNGVLQFPDAYTQLSPTAISFTEPLYTTDVVEVVFMQSVIGIEGPQGDTGPQGPQGETGPQGPQGDPGTDGVDGLDGLGVPLGGTTGQILSKASDTDNDTAWTDPPLGGGWTSADATATDTAVPVGGYMLVTGATPRTVSLPASPEPGDICTVAVDADAGHIVDRSGKLIMGIAENLTIDLPYRAVTLLFVNDTHGWRII